jgi:hypothetical protein
VALFNSKVTVTVNRDFSLSLTLHFSKMEKQRFWLVLRVRVFSILKGVYVHLHEKRSSDKILVITLGKVS